MDKPIETLEGQTASTEESKPTDSYVKLAMRNMVRKGGLSLKHFFLTTIGLIAFLIGISYLTKP
jgi:hypothetical protein